MQKSIKKAEGFISSPLFKGAAWLISIVFIAGAAFNKIEYRLNEMPKEIAVEIIKQLTELEKKVDNHILSDKYEKQILESKLTLLSEKYNDLSLEVKSIREFTRPQEPKIETERKYR